jgi:hypothetical protein
MGGEVLRPRDPRGETVGRPSTHPPIGRTRTSGLNRPLQIPGIAGIIRATDPIGICTLCIDDRWSAL